MLMIQETMETMFMNHKQSLPSSRCFIPYLSWGRLQVPIGLHILLHQLEPCPFRCYQGKQISQGEHPIPNATTNLSGVRWIFKNDMQTSTYRDALFIACMPLLSTTFCTRKIGFKCLFSFTNRCFMGHFLLVTPNMNIVKTISMFWNIQFVEHL
jgi:hypothetical protein